jgi:hypothetical protein
MERVLSCLVAGALGLASLGAVQSQILPPSDGQRSPDRHGLVEGDYAVVVQGCVQGTRLKRLEGVRDRAGEVLNVSDWILTGSPGMMRQIENDFHRHHVEVVGMAVLPRAVHPRRIEIDLPNVSGAIVTMRARARPEHSFFPPAGEDVPVRMNVTSVRTIAERCG